jgi:hydrogenase maturation factor
MTTFEVPGPGCENCKKPTHLTKDAGTTLSSDEKIIKRTHYAEIMRVPIISTPGLVINEKGAVSGRVPGEAEITTFLANALV